MGDGVDVTGSMGGFIGSLVCMSSASNLLCIEFVVCRTCTLCACVAAHGTTCCSKARHLFNQSCLHQGNKLFSCIGSSNGLLAACWLQLPAHSRVTAG